MLLSIFSSLIWISFPKPNLYFLSLKNLFRPLYPKDLNIDVGLNLRVGQKFLFGENCEKDGKFCTQIKVPKASLGSWRGNYLKCICFGVGWAFSVR